MRGRLLVGGHHRQRAEGRRMGGRRCSAVANKKSNLWHWFHTKPPHQGRNVDARDAMLWPRGQLTLNMFSECELACTNLQRWVRGRDKSFLPSSHVVEKCVRTFHDVIARKAFPFNIPEGDERKQGYSSWTLQILPNVSVFSNRIQKAWNLHYYI